MLSKLFLKILCRLIHTSWELVDGLAAYIGDHLVNSGLFVFSGSFHFISVHFLQPVTLCACARMLVCASLHQIMLRKKSRNISDTRAPLGATFTHITCSFQASRSGVPRTPIQWSDLFCSKHPTESWTYHPDRSSNYCVPRRKVYIDRVALQTCVAYPNY